MSRGQFQVQELNPFLEWHLHTTATSLEVASEEAKRIAVDDLDRFDRKQYRYFSQQNATKILDAVAEGDTEGAVEALKTALLFKVHHRVKPQMVKTGEEVEEELFWLNQYGHK